jgi:hypothetical protein
VYSSVGDGASGLEPVCDALLAYPLLLHDDNAVLAAGAKQDGHAIYRVALFCTGRPVQDSFSERNAG